MTKYMFFGGPFHCHASEAKIERHEYQGEPRWVADLYLPHGEIVRYFLCKVIATHKDWDAKMTFRAFFTEGTPNAELDELMHDALTLYGMGPESAQRAWDVQLAFTAP